MERGDERKSITRAAGLMSAATLISRILGYIKDMILAGFFGATGVADTFFVAFRIPNLLRELFAEGSMSSAFIPVLTEYRAKQGEEEGRRLVRITFTFILIVVGVLCITGIIFAPAIVTVIAPGFLSDPEKFSVTVLLTRIMFPFLLFMSIASLAMGALNTRRVFFIPSLSPVMLNLSMIGMVLFVAPLMEQPIVTVAAGVVLGGFMQFVFQLPSFWQNGYSLKPAYEFGHEGLKKMAILMMPATMGMAVAQVNIFVSTVFASYLPEGSVTYLYYSMRLVQFPVGIFGVAMAMAVLPSLSQHAVKGDYHELSKDLSFALRILFFITIPAMAGLIALREPIVNLLFQRGRFDYAATVGTAQALLFYSVGIWSIVGVRTITASFYSMQDTKTPVKVAAISVAANVFFSIALMGPLKHSGLALANSLASGINFALLFYFLRKKLVRLDGRRIIRSFLKTAFASLVIGVAGAMILHGDLWRTHGNIGLKIFSLGGTMLFCVILYAVITFIIRSEECTYILGMVKRKTENKIE